MKLNLIFSVMTLAFAISAHTHAADVMTQLGVEAGDYFGAEYNYCSVSVQTVNVPRGSDAGDVRQLIANRVKSDSQFAGDGIVTNIRQVEEGNTKAMAATYYSFARVRDAEFYEHKSELEAEEIEAQEQASKLFKATYFRVINSSGSRVFSGTLKVSNLSGRIFAIQGGSKLVIIVLGHNGC
jgi:hypothetical protein